MTTSRPAVMGAWSPARLAARVGLLACGLLFVAVWTTVNAEQPPPVTSLLKSLDLASYRSGTRPPHFSGHTVDARQISLSNFRGKVVVVNFWASWCLECRPEMPVLERLHRELTPRGLTVVSVNARESTSAIVSYARELGLTFPLVVDPDGKINALYGVIGFPTTFVIARDGRAVAFAIGPREWESAPARSLFNALLAEPAARPAAQ
jgi:cytochrome c biogenesis protein CcmG/thiol:disulfide interchange protein DsbE